MLLTTYLLISFYKSTHTLGRNRPVTGSLYLYLYLYLVLQVVGCGGMDWIDVAQNRDRWRALEKSVINFRVTYNAGNFLTS